MSDPPPAAYTAQQIRAADRTAIDKLGIPGLVLMENAGRVISQHVRTAAAKTDTPRVTILCGPGNNGGDGFVIARHLQLSNIPTIVVLAADRAKSRGDADLNLRIIEHLAIPIVDAATPEGLAEARDAIACATVIVDALLGTGATGPCRDPMATLIVLANAAEGVRIAVDVPTGLDADTGEASPPCFQAAITVTLLAHKIGLLNPNASSVVGQLHVGDIGVAPDVVLPTPANTSAENLGN
jgi:NAD(P)H-hydrate epimerase